MRDLATRLSLPFNSPFSSLLGGTQCVYVYDVIVLLFSEGYLCLWISSGHPRHAAMSAWSGLVGFFVEMQLDSSLSLSLSLENAQGCRGCLMVLRERRSGLVGLVRGRGGGRRCGFEARLHEGCDGCVLSRGSRFDCPNLPPMGM